MVTLVAVLALTLASTIGEDFAFSFARPTIANAASAQTFVVLYGQQAVSASSRTAIRQAGGTLVYAYDQIGVVIASSASAPFPEDLMRLVKSGGNAARTPPFATPPRGVDDADGPTPRGQPHLHP